MKDDLDEEMAAVRADGGKMMVLPLIVERGDGRLLVGAWGFRLQTMAERMEYRGKHPTGQKDGQK